VFEKLADIEVRFNEIEQSLSDPEVVAKREKYVKLMKERSELEDVVYLYRERMQLKQEIEDNREMLEDPDPEMKELAQQEIEQAEKKVLAVDEKLKLLLVPKDPADEKNVLLEIRAGTGGEEASLFAAELFRAYTRYAEAQRWKVDLISLTHSSTGGYKEVIAMIEGRGAYSRLKFESGVHRVQRVPVTESGGRIHTSAVTVAVLPEADEVEVELDPHELRIDVFRSTGPGGQSVNTTDSAVRITHAPTGLVVTCQDEKSQHKNKAKALKVLRARLLDIETEKQQSEITEKRRSMVGSGDRSEKIRTYNFPQTRVTDHRINMTSHRLPEIMEGAFDPFIEALSNHYQAEGLKKGA
jgi:peptide chain release factor 1